MSRVGLGCATAAMIALLLNSGCASTQLNYNTTEIGATIDNIYTRETLNNLSKFIDEHLRLRADVGYMGKRRILVHYLYLYRRQFLWLPGTSVLQG